MKLYLHLHDRGMFEKSLNATYIALISKMIRVDLIGSVQNSCNGHFKWIKECDGRTSIQTLKMHISMDLRERLEKVYDHINWGVLFYMLRR